MKREAFSKREHWKNFRNLIIRKTLVFPKVIHRSWGLAKRLQYYRLDKKK